MGTLLVDKRISCQVTVVFAQNMYRAHSYKYNRFDIYLPWPETRIVHDSYVTCEFRK
jgi:hypothetical protein